jgi:SpoVK/Ycf46/Vps4 family AAA+-type ATPase
VKKATNGGLCSPFAGRAQLVGEYVGQTAPRTEALFKKAKGSLLLIEEAYGLLDDRGGSYGDEALNTLFHQMEKSPDPIVILAGYPDRMRELIDRNEGLRSRIKFYVDFPDYSAEELFEIPVRHARDNGFRLAGDVRDKALPMLSKATKNVDAGNGRFARNLFEIADLNRAARIDRLAENEVTRADLATLRAADFEEPKIIGTKSARGTIGFRPEPNVETATKQSPGDD